VVAHIEAGDDPKNTSGMISMKVSENHSILYPNLSRDTGAKILRLIQDGVITRRVKIKDTLSETDNKEFTYEPVRCLVNSKNFAGNSLFCEWAYVVDMDEETLEIYTGFNKGKAKGRFAKIKKYKEYSPVTLWRTLTFKDIKKRPDCMKELQAEYKKEQDEEG